MKEEKLQLISQKCKGPQETTMNIYTNKLDNLEEIETFLQNKHFPKRESWRNRKSEYTNY